jgi:putative aldouronate transport system permease protein
MMKESGITKKRPHFLMSAGDRVFMIVNFIFLCFIFLIIAYPILYIISASFSGGLMQGESGLSLIPREATLEGYRAIFEYKWILTGYINSIIYTFVGTVLAMVVQTLCAYTLSRKDFLGRKVLLVLCIFCMYFEGGIIPLYLWISKLGLTDSIWAVTLPFTLSIYNVIVLRTYFSTQIPDEIREASQIDGCGDWRLLMTIVIPLSGPVLAVITLYSAVYFWNSYFYPLIFLQTRAKLPLPNILREILIINTMTTMESGMDAQTAAILSKRADIMKFSLIIVASVPPMIFYPIIQKYFVKGVMIGAVKG